MTSRQRVEIALQHKEPDRVPIDFWCSRAMAQKLEHAKGKPLGELLDDWDVDLRYAEGPRYIGPPLGPDADLWGVRRVSVAAGGESYSDVIEFPLASATTVPDIESYSHWPSADWFDYAPLRQQCETIRASGRVACFMGDRLNRIAQLKPAMYLRGVQQILVDLVASPQIARAIFRRIRSFYLEYERRALEAAGGALDILVTGDDFGTQQGPLLAPLVWRRFFKRRYRALFEPIRRAGKKVLFHSCGQIEPFLEELRDVGASAIWPQLPLFDHCRLARRCRELGLAVQLHPDRGELMQRARPREVREYIQRLVEEFDCLSGGSWLYFEVDPGFPWANVRAMFETAMELRATAH